MRERKKNFWKIYFFEEKHCHKTQHKSTSCALPHNVQKKPTPNSAAPPPFGILEFLKNIFRVDLCGKYFCRIFGLSFYFAPPHKRFEFAYQSHQIFRHSVQLLLDKIANQPPIITRCCKPSHREAKSICISVRSDSFGNCCSASAVRNLPLSISDFCFAFRCA